MFLAAAAMMLPSATIAPIAWQDDAQITDHGRVLLSGDRSFGLSLSESGDAMVTPFVLGPLLSETLFLLGGHLAVRIGSILLAGLASLLLYLVGRRLGGESPVLPMLLALAFFFSYSFSQNFRSGRFDVLAFGLTFAAVLLLASGVKKEHVSRRQYAWSSAAMGLALATWPTAVLLTPLWLLMLARSWPSGARNPRELVMRVGFVVVPPAVIGTSVLFLISIRVGDAAPSDVVAAWASRLGSVAASDSGRSLAGDIVLLARTALPDAFFAIIPTFVLLFSRARRRALPWVGALTLIAAAVVFTNPYIHRAIYLIAALALASAVLLAEVTARPRRAMTLLFAVLVPVLAGAQLIARPATAILDLDNRSGAAADAATDGITCSDGTLVYLDTWRLYYELREDGCRMDRLYSGGRNEVEAYLSTAFGSYDYLVLSGTSADWARLDVSLKTEGWQGFERGAGSQYRSPIVVYQPVQSTR